MTTEDEPSFQGLLGKEEVIRLALRELDDEDPMYSRIREALEAALDDADCPLTEIGHDDLDVLDKLLLELEFNGDAAVEEALAVSLRRLKCETGWDPGLLPLSRPLLVGRLSQSLVRALGAIALAWQVQTHPQDIMLTAGKLVLALN